MAVVGKGFAILQTGRIRISGVLAWMAWAAVHLEFLGQSSLRVSVFVQKSKYKREHGKTGSFGSYRRGGGYDRDQYSTYLNRRMAGSRIEGIVWAVLVHSARTAVAAVASLLTAGLFRLPEAYWAPITTLVITQSSLGAAFHVSWQRLVGTALGALLGAIAATYFAPNVVVLGICVFILGLLRVLARLELLAYRFAGMTLAIVFLIPRTGDPWQIAFHRLAEVSIGIAVALILAWVWPEKEAVLSEKKSILERFLGKGWI